MGIMALLSTFGHQTQVTLPAPTEAKMLCTCRHIEAKWPAEFPLTFSLHKFQFPFISASKRRKNG